MSINLEISLSIPILTSNLSAIEESVVHNFNAFLGIKVLLKFYLYDSFRMIVKKTNSLYLSNFLQFACNVTFNLWHFRLTICLFKGKNISHNHYSKSITFLLSLLLPIKQLVFILFCQHFFYFCLFFSLSSLVFFVFLIEVSFLNFYNETISNLTLI